MKDIVNPELHGFIIFMDLFGGTPLTLLKDSV